MLSKSLSVLLVVYFVSDFSFAQKNDTSIGTDYENIEGLQGVYKFHTTPKNWRAAKQACADEDASLFYPINSNEANAAISFWKLHDNKTNYAASWLYVGISDIDTEGVFLTVDGKSISEVYNNWAFKQPDNYKDKEDCVHLGKNGHLNDVACNTPYSFICEKKLSLKQNNSIDVHQPDSDEQKAKDENTTEYLQKAEGVNTTEYVQKAEDENTTEYEQKAEGVNTTEYVQKAEDENTTEYEQKAEGVNTTEYVQKAEDENTTEYEQKAEGVNTTEYEQKAKDKNITEYEQKAEHDNITEYEQKAEHENITEYEQKVDDENISEYEQKVKDKNITEYEQKAKDKNITEYEQTAADENTTEYEQKAEHENITEYEQKAEHENISEYEQKVKDENISEYEQTVKDKNTTEYEQKAEHENTTEYELKAEHENITEYEQKAKDKNTTGYEQKAEDEQQTNKFFRKDYNYIEAVESFYKIHTVGHSWAEAKRVCALEGATFWHPDNDDEAHAVISFWNATQPHIGWVYVGLSDMMAKRLFVTTDGKTVSEVYNNWHPYQPDNYNGKQHCVYMYNNGYLDDYGCTYDYSFICKKTLQSLEWNSQCNMSNLGYTFDEDIGKCYKLHTTPLNWTEAYAVCQREQSQLAVISNQLEAEYLAKLTQSTPNPRVKENYQRGIYHVGLHNQFNEGWQTVRGTVIDVAADVWWDSYKPEDDRAQCGSMFYTGHLINTDCSTKSFFICEHDINSS